MYLSFLKGPIRLPGNLAKTGSSAPLPPIPVESKLKEALETYKAKFEEQKQQMEKYEKKLIEQEKALDQFKERADEIQNKWVLQMF